MSGMHSLGPFQLNEERAVLIRDGQAVAIGQRAMALLLALAAARGKAVSKADLLEAAWPGLAVEEGNLTVQIAGLRKHLGQDAEGRDWIVTVPRLGYRLVTAQAQVPEPAGAERPVLAVLPFENLSGDSDSDYFAEGIVADVIAALTRFSKLAVVSRSASFAFKGQSADPRAAAAALGASYVLAGSVRRMAARLRINAELVDATSALSLWTERFDGDLAEVFDFQDRITEKVATLVAPAIEASELALSRQKRPESLATHDILLRAKAFIDDESEPGNRAALDLLNEALRREPGNAQIIGQTVWALEHRLSMGWPRTRPDDAERCVELARRGIQLAAGDARIMAQCAIALFQPGRDYTAAMAVIASAASRNPHDLYVLQAAGIIHLHCGTLEEATSFLNRAIALGQHDANIRFALTGSAHIHILLGHHETALDFATRSLAQNDRFDATYWMLIAANAHLGRIEAARDWLAALLRIAPDVSLARIVASQASLYPDRFDPVAKGLRLAGFPD